MFDHMMISPANLPESHSPSPSVPAPSTLLDQVYDPYEFNIAIDGSEAVHRRNAARRGLDVVFLKAPNVEAMVESVNATQTFTRVILQSQCHILASNDICLNPHCGNHQKYVNGSYLTITISTASLLSGARNCESEESRAMVTELYVNFPFFSPV
jgi:hypothetical protein